MNIENLDGDFIPFRRRRRGYRGMAPRFFRGDEKPGLWESLKSTAKKVLTLPGKVVAANVEPVTKAAGQGVGEITGPLIPILLIGLAGAYFYFTSQKVNVNVER